MVVLGGGFFAYEQGTPIVGGVLRDQICATQGPKVDSVRQVDF
jgi:hypothetical protein